MDVVIIKEIAATQGSRRDKAEDLLADPDIQAVYIASPVSLHSEQILAAAKAGKHILCEKPLTMNSEQAVQAVAACKKAGVFLQEGYMMKFHGAHQAIRDIIASAPQWLYARQLSCWYPAHPGAWRQDSPRAVAAHSSTCHPLV